MEFNEPIYKKVVSPLNVMADHKSSNKIFKKQEILSSYSTAKTIIIMLLNLLSMSILFEGTCA